EELDERAGAADVLSGQVGGLERVDADAGLDGGVEVEGVGVVHVAAGLVEDLGEADREDGDALGVGGVDVVLEGAGEEGAGSSDLEAVGGAGVDRLDPVGAGEGVAERLAVGGGGQAVGRQVDGDGRVVGDAERGGDGAVGGLAGGEDGGDVALGGGAVDVVGGDVGRALARPGRAREARLVTGVGGDRGRRVGGVVERLLGLPDLVLEHVGGRASAGGGGREGQEEELFLGRCR